MKKLLLFVVLSLISLGIYAQSTDVGVTGGYLNARASAKAEDISISDSESGFYLGLVVDFGITEKFHIQPELLYANVNQGSGLILPVMGKFYLNDKFNLQVGPQFVFSLEDVPEDFSGVEFDFAGGLGVDITDALFVEARYSFQINNSYTGDEDITVRGNYLTLGIGFMF